MFLAELLGLGADDRDPRLAAARRDRRLGADQLRRAWLDWLGAEVAARPLVIVVDDLQWADAASLAHLDAALAALADRPLLIIGFARPELAALAPALWRDRPLDRVVLAPLAPRAAAELVSAALGPIAPARAARMVELAAGNPYFLEELLRHGDDDALPASVRAIAHGRIAALPILARRVLRAASLVPAITATALARVVGEPEETIASALATLVASDLLIPTADGHGFRSELYRIAALEGLVDQDRARS